MLRKAQRDTAIIMDEKLTTPSDYTIMVSNFPRVKGAKLKESIINWAEKQAKKTDDRKDPRLVNE